MIINESVQKFVGELKAAPSTAIQKLIIGYSGVSAWSKSSLNECFAEIFIICPETLDTAITEWLQIYLINHLPPENVSPIVWAADLEKLFSSLEGQQLPKTDCLLRDRLCDFHSWLHPLRMEDVDPEAAYLFALSRIKDK